MRFAFTAAQSNCTWDELAELWDVADGLDVFTTGWVYDHFYPLRTGPEEPTLEGWTCLAMLLARTRRLRGGVLVTGIPYRHPAVLANMAVTVDIASGGRLELGVGAGWFEPECEAYGIELGTIAERFARFEEALDRHPLAAHPADDELRRAATTGCATRGASRRRSQQPHPPIVLGGKGERRLLPLVARLRRPLELLRRRPRASSPACAAAWPSCATAEGAAIDDLTLSANVRPPAEDPVECRRPGRRVRRRRRRDDLRPAAPALRPSPARAARPGARRAAVTTRQLGDEVGHLAHERLLQHGADQRHVRRRVGAGERLAGTTGWRRRP